MLPKLVLLRQIGARPKHRPPLDLGSLVCVAKNSQKPVFWGKAGQSFQKRPWIDR